MFCEPPPRGHLPTGQTQVEWEQKQAEQSRQSTLSVDAADRISPHVRLAGVEHVAENGGFVRFVCVSNRLRVDLWTGLTPGCMNE